MRLGRDGERESCKSSRFGSDSSMEPTLPMSNMRHWKRTQYIWRQRAKAWLGRRGLPIGRSQAAAEFVRLKAKRARLAPPDLSALRVPGQEGLVSIVLPVYNGADYVGESIASTLAQTYRDFELIIVDDGSTDQTPEILANYARRDARIRVVTQPNQKLPGALSNGFRLARGEFLTWTSADNRFKPEFLEKMVGCLRRHPAWDMIYANEDIIGEDGRPLRGSEWFWPYQRPLGSEHIHFPEDTAELNGLGNNFIGGAFLYRARVRFLIGDYSPEWFGLEDYDYWMRVNALLALHHADFREPVYEYRLHGKSLTSREAELRIEEKRRELVAVDRLRRRSAEEPILWHLEAEAGSASAAQLKRAMESALSARGHRVWPGKGESSSANLGGPMVHASVVENPLEQAPLAGDLSAGAMRVLIVCSDEPSLPEVQEMWNLCVAFSSRTDATQLPRDRQGWMVTDRIETLIAAIDIRTRGHCPEKQANALTL